jgi:hypothetical protein
MVIHLKVKRKNQKSGTYVFITVTDF